MALNGTEGAVEESASGFQGFLFFISSIPRDKFFGLVNRLVLTPKNSALFLTENGIAWGIVCQPHLQLLCKTFHDLNILVVPLEEMGVILGQLILKEFQVGR